ncbi:MAG TPA: restriction endonuclease subunit S [Candidatus Nanoarchaeia archaeon]|nr:restriction endonuclease subunit S [Candidatus Nanoarchaeia archaeon]
MAQTNILKLSEVRNQERMDSEYFQKIILKLVSKIEKLPNQRLGDLCLVKSGRTPKYSEEGKVKVIRSGDLNRDLFVDRDELLKTNEQKLFFVNNNDIFISSIGRGSIGKINIYDEKEKLATVSEVNVLRNPKINPYYLFIFLRTIFGQEQINREITGATGQLHLLKSNTKKMLIPIPSDKFQKEIEKEVLLAKKYYEESKELYEKAEEILLKEMGVEDYI